MDFGDSGSGTAKASVVAVGGCEYTKNGDIDEDIGDGGGGDFVNALADFAVRNTSGGGDDDEEEEEDDDDGIAAVPKAPPVGEYLAPSLPALHSCKSTAADPTRRAHAVSVRIDPA
jgi:hypothetical protein